MALKDIKLKQAERVLHVVHRYGLTLFPQWISGFLFISLAFFLMFWLFGKGAWGQVGFVFLLLTGVVVLFRTYFLWRKNMMIITTHRIIDIDQPRFLERHVSEVSLDKIEDVVGKMSGFMQALGKYGSLHIQTAGGTLRIEVEYIKRPLYVQQMINELRERYMLKYIHDFSGDLALTILDKLHELEEEDLLKVQKTTEKLLRKKQLNG